MSQIKEGPTKGQQKTVKDESSVSETNRGGQSSGINDIFEAMQKNFDQTFNTTTTESVPKLSTQQITTEAIKQAPQTNRSTRKLKPIYTTLVKKQSPSNDQNLNSDVKSDGQDQRVFSRQKQTPNIKATSNESGQKSDKSSPYAKIMGRLHQSAVSEYYPHQTHPTSIQDIHTQRKNNQALQGNQVQDKSINHTSASPRALNYKDLQQKIESALKKNSHYKAFGTSRLNKSNLTSRTFNQCNEMMLSRFQQYEKNREREIQQKKSELEQRKQKQLKFHPKINKKSIQFVQQMGGHQPLQNRYQKILEQKSKRLQQYEEHKKQKEEEEYEMFMQEFLKHQKSPEESTRSYDKFYEEMFKWKQRSKKKAQEKKRVMEENEMKETSTFHPKINKNSCKIVMNSTKSEKKIPIYERQVPGEKKFKSKIDEQCTFKPKINKRRIK